MKWAVSMSSTTIDRNILASMGMTTANDREQELFINAITKRYRQSLRLIGIMAITILLGFITIIFTISSIYGRIVVAIFGMIVFIFAGIISRVLLGNQREELRRLNTMKIEKVSAKFEKATVSSSGRYGGTNYLIKVKEINGWYNVGREYFKIEENPQEVTLSIYAYNTSNGYCKTYLVTEY